MKTKVKTLAWGATIGILVTSVAGAWAASAPMAVSPGDAAGASISGACPTLSWGPVEEAEAYELVIYRVGEEGVEGEPVLSQHIPSAALAWSPSLDHCLEPGEAYAWSVRAVTGGSFSDWAEPLFFEVTPQPSADELAAALEVLRRHYAVESGTDAAQQDPATGRSMLEPSEAPDTRPPRMSAAPVAGSAGNPGAKLTVVGEVRTVDSNGEPRLWGRGRSGLLVYPRVAGGGDYCQNHDALLEFGLSGLAVDWASAADTCPAGTWVCKSTELTACNTGRLGNAYGRLCDGTTFNAPDANVWGWVADVSQGSHIGGLFNEDGRVGFDLPCKNYPVWCCW